MNRIEKILFEFSVSKIDQDIRIIKPDVQDLEPGDSLKIAYTVFIDYYDNVNKKLEALVRLANKGVKISAKELRFGKSIIQSILSKIEFLEKQ